MPDPTPTTSTERVRTESKNLRPGTVLVWRGDESGTTVTLKERKADESGWWCVEGGGLADYVLDSPTSLHRVAPSPPGAERVAALEAEIRLLREMVALLTEAESASLGYLHAHGWHTDPALVERGKQIREQLATLDEHA